jgi:cytochrome c553
MRFFRPRRALVCAAAVSFVWAAGCAARFVRATGTETVDRTPERLRRGEYLVETVSACGVCHSGRDGGDFVFDGESTSLHLAGGYGLALPEMGLDLWFPNLTPDARTGLGRWSDDEVMRAIRDGVSRDGRMLVPAMPYRSYRAMSDEDVRSVVAYLRSLPAVSSPAPPRPSRVRGLAGFLLARGAEHRAPAAHVSAPDPSDRVAWGGYLVRIAGCPDCHARKTSGVMRAPADPMWMAGGAWDDLPGVGRVYMRNLTPDRATGLGRWTQEDFIRAMRTGMRLDGKRMAPPMSLYMAHWSAMDDADLKAIAEYLFSLPPASNPVPERALVPDVRDAYDR